MAQGGGSEVWWRDAGLTADCSAVPTPCGDSVQSLQYNDEDTTTTIAIATASAGGNDSRVRVDGLQSDTESQYDRFAVVTRASGEYGGTRQAAVSDVGASGEYGGSGQAAVSDVVWAAARAAFSVRDETSNVLCRIDDEPDPQPVCHHSQSTLAAAQSHVLLAAGVKTRRLQRFGVDDDLCEGADSAAEAEHQLNFYAACDDVDTQTLSTLSARLMMTPPEVDFTRAPPVNSADHGLLSTTTTTATRPTAIAAAVVPDNDSAVRVDVTESSQYEAEFAVGPAAVSRGTDDEHASTPSRQLQQQTAATSDTEVERSSMVDQLVRVFSVSRAPAACACYTHADQQRASNASILTRHQLSTLPTHGHFVRAPVNSTADRGVYEKSPADGDVYKEQLELPAVDLETNAQPHDASSAIITTTPPPCATANNLTTVRGPNSTQSGSS